MVGWHHRLNGHEFEQTPGDGEGQGSLACCGPWGLKQSDTTEPRNNNKSNKLMSHSLLNSHAYSPVESTRFRGEGFTRLPPGLMTLSSPGGRLSFQPTVYKSEVPPPLLSFGSILRKLSLAWCSVPWAPHPVPHKPGSPPSVARVPCSVPHPGSSRFPWDGAIIALTSLLSHLSGAHCPLLPISRVLKYFLKTSFIFCVGGVSGRYLNLVPVTLSWPGAEIYNSLVNFYIPFWIQQVKPY